MKIKFLKIFQFSLLVVVLTSFVPAFASSGCISPTYYMSSKLTKGSNTINYTRAQSKDSNTEGEVSALQSFLKAKGYLRSDVVTTGAYGTQTLNAVKKFQRENGINPTGATGPATRAAISRISCAEQGADVVVSSLAPVVNTSSNLVAQPLQVMSAVSSRFTTKAGIMDAIRKYPCMFDSILFPNVEDKDGYYSMLARSKCVYLPRVVETWSNPPIWQTITANMDLIKSKTDGKSYVYGMFIAESIDTTANYFDDTGRKFDFAAMCRPGSQNHWGTNTCIPTTNSEEYMRYLRYIITKAMDVGIQDFMFGQTGHQDTSRKLPAFVAEMRQLAAQKGVAVVFGQQPNDLSDETYLKSFDYINGSTCPEGVSAHEYCIQNTDIVKNKSKANLVLAELDWSSVSDDIHLFAKMNSNDRKSWLTAKINNLSSLGVAFNRPFRIPLNGGADGACHGSNQYVYSPDNKYGCKDEDFLNATFVQSQVTVVPAPVVKSFTASKTTIVEGELVTLSWINTNAQGCKISVNEDSVPLDMSSNGTYVVSPSTTSEYRIVCYNGTSYSPIVSTKITVNQPAPTVTSSWSPSTVTSGGSATYSYSSTNAIKCKVTHASGQGTWDPADTVYTNTYRNLTANDTTYVTCYNSQGVASDQSAASLKVTVPVVENTCISPNLKVSNTCVIYDGVGPSLDSINVLYVLFLNRQADIGGLQYWDSTNKSISDITAAIKASSEYTELHPVSCVEPVGIAKVLGASTMCLSLTRDIHRGNESQDTKDLQTFLIKKGLLTESVTGFYGDSTVAAVKSYQTSKNLPATGMVYSFTRQAIEKDSCGD